MCTFCATRMPFVTKKLAPSLGKNVCNQRCFKATSGSLYPVLVKRRIALQSPSAAKAPERTMNGGPTDGSQVLDEVSSGGTTGEIDNGVQSQPKHLLLMVNGLFGSAENWIVTRRNLEKLGQSSGILMLASNTNLKLQTFDGIDSCGRRLAAELKECVEAHSSLKYISVIGHSMGGLIARYAVGMLFDKESSKIAGLEPRHFISMATPHLGCGGEGPAQVPFIGWTSDVPVVGGAATRFLQYCTNSFASMVMRKTGEQFFLLDGNKESKPLLVTMAEDGPDGGFYSALKAFKSRTCLANSSGDHLVGWANSSVRHPDELPDLGDLTKARGIVREDPPEAALWGPSPPHRNSESTEESRIGENRQSSGQEERKRSDAEDTLRSSQEALYILNRLQDLPWCRMDCSFKGTTFPYFAHNLIQVTREWLNWEGEAVVQRLAEHFANLEKLLDEASSETIKALDS